MKNYVVEIDDVTLFSFYALILRVGSKEQEDRVDRWLNEVNDDQREIATYPSEPKWDELPKWMNVVTRDANGKWYGYAEMPLLFPEEGCWLSGGLRCLYVSNKHAPKLDKTPWYSSIYVREKHG